MIRERDAGMRPAPQDNQLMSKPRVLSFKPQLRLEWRRQDGQNETQQPDHSASLGDSVTSSTRIRFSIHTGRSASRPALLSFTSLMARAQGSSECRPQSSERLRPISPPEPYEG